MDSVSVTRHIKSRIVPALKSAEFEGKGRTFWRRRPYAVNVVHFQSFSKYTADIIGCTTFSLTVNLGVYYPCYHWIFPDPSRSPNQPSIWTCHALRQLAKTLPQPELARKDIWNIHEDGSNLNAVIQDVSDAMIQQGMPFFDEWSDVERALALFRSDKAEEGYRSGAPGSPARKKIIQALERQVDVIKNGKARGFELTE
jgi:hypothetical protein